MYLYQGILVHNEIRGEFDDVPVPHPWEDHRSTSSNTIADPVQIQQVFHLWVFDRSDAHKHFGFPFEPLVTNLLG